MMPENKKYFLILNNLRLDGLGLFTSLNQPQPVAVSKLKSTLPVVESGVM
jgi:hypothetical protein